MNAKCDSVKIVGILNFGALSYWKYTEVVETPERENIWVPHAKKL